MARILVVDDAAIVREPIAAFLRSRGHECICAKDGREAILLGYEQQPDLVLLDVVMPGMDGLAFLRSLRGDARLAATPVLMLTLSNDKRRVLEAASLGVRGYILKSNFSMDDLLKRIDGALSDAPVIPEDSEEEGASASEATGDCGDSNCSDRNTACDLSPQGQVAGSVRDLKPLVTRSQMREILDNCGELKALSPTVAQVLKMTQSRDCSIEALGKVIKQDQAISLKVLKLANSSVYTRGEPVDTVSKAVMRIGLAQTRQMVLNLSVVERFSEAQPDKPQRIDLFRFWEHSIATGIIAAELTRATGGHDAQVDAAFTMGLLHDVGRLVYLETLGETYSRVLDEAQRLRQPLELVESRLLLINHAEAMDRILHGWRFPKELINPIALHHLSVGNSRRLSPHSVREVSILALADRLAHALMLGDSGNPVLYSTTEFAQTIRVDESLITRIADAVPEQTADLRLAMLANAAGTSKPDVLSQVRQRLEEPVNPIFIGPDAGIDGFRLLCRRLAEGQERPPNIAIIHIPHARHRSILTSSLTAAESSAGGLPLPLVLLSPTGEFQLEDGAMDGRTYKRLAVPLDLSSFVAALDEVRSARASAAVA